MITAEQARAMMPDAKFYIDKLEKLIPLMAADGKDEATIELPRSKADEVRKHFANLQFRVFVLDKTILTGEDSGDLYYLIIRW